MGMPTADQPRAGRADREDPFDIEGDAGCRFHRHDPPAFRLHGWKANESRFAERERFASVA